MPTERVFDECDVLELVDKNSAPPQGRRDVALIIGRII